MGLGYADTASLSTAAESLGVHDGGDRTPRNARADRFCFWHDRDDGTVRPIVATEYKPPHKLNIKEIHTGLSSKI